MAGKFVALDLTTLWEFQSNIKQSPRKREKEEKEEETEKGIDRSRIEETKKKTYGKVNFDMLCFYMGKCLNCGFLRKY